MSICAKMSGSKKKCHQKEYWCPKRLEFDNEYEIVSKELIGAADLIKVQFDITIKHQFPQRLIRMGALRGPTKASFFVLLG